MVSQYGFYFDSSRCTGCKTCELSCKDYKNLSTDTHFRRIYEYTGGDWINNGTTWQQNIFSYYTSISCNHCDSPACVSVCPTGAMHKDQHGFVTVNEDICVGCRYCQMACPYSAPQYNEEKGHMTKCDGCRDRVLAGALPVCVESCPLRALDFGPIEDMRKKYGTLADIAPLPAASFTHPNLVIKANTQARPAGDRSGHLSNPQEV